MLASVKRCTCSATCSLGDSDACLYIDDAYLYLYIPVYIYIQRRFILPAPPPPAAVAPAAPDAITHAANARTPIQTSAVRSLAPSAPAASAAVANKADIAARMEALKLKEAALQAKIDEAAKREQNSELLQEEATVTAATAQEVLSEAEQQAIAAEVQANLEAEKAIADKAKKAKWRAERKAAREAQRRGVSSLASKVADEISSEGSTTSLIGDAAHRKAQRAARVKSLGGIGALLADALDGAGGIDGEDIKSALAEVDPTTAEEEAAATKVPPTVPAKPSKEPPAVAAQPTDDGAAGVAVDPALAALKAEMEAMKAEMAKARADVDAERAARLLAEKHAEAVSATSPSAPTPQVKAPLGNIAEGSAILADATKRLRPTVAGSSSESSEKDKRRQSAELVGELAETLERRKSLPPQIMPKPRKPSMAGDAPEWANPRGDGEGEDGAVSSDSSQSLSPDNDDNGGDDASSSAGTDYEVVDEEDDLERDEEKAKETHGKFMDTFFNKNEDEERQAKEHEEAKAAAAAAAAAAEEAAAAAQKEEEAALAAEVNAAISHAPEGTGTYRSRALFAANPKKGQLGFSKGEYLYAIPTDRGWWAAVNVQGDEGKVPSNFLVEVHSMEVEDNATAAVEAATVEDEQEAAAAAALIAAGEQEAAAAAVEEAAAAADAAVAAAAAAAAEAAAAAAAAEAEANAANSADTPVGPEGTEPFTAKANFEPNKKKGQLGFRKGELLFAVQTSKGWWVAANEAGEEGKVPSNFLKPYVAPAASEPAPPKARPRSSIGSIAKSGGSRKEKALAWCRELVVGTDIAIDNFGSSWADGLAFCGIMAGLMPDKIDLTACAGNDRRENYTLAFWVALEAGQEPLLDVDDLMESPHPEPLACQTYIFELFRKFSAGGQLAHNVTGKLL